MLDGFGGGAREFAVEVGKVGRPDDDVFAREVAPKVVEAPVSDGKGSS